MRNRLFYLISISLILLGIFFRFQALANSGSYWYDEILSIEFAQKPFLEMWQYLRLDTNPPLYYLLVGMWGRIFGFGEIAMRSFALVWGILTIPAIYILAGKLFDRKTGILAAVLYSLSTFAIYYSTEARMYSLLFFLITLSLYSFWTLVHQDRPYSKPALYGYFLFTLAALYVHITAIWLLIAQGTYLLIKRKHYALLFFTMPVIAILFLPWLWSLGNYFMELHHLGVLSSGWIFYFISSSPTLVDTPLSFLVLTTLRSIPSLFYALYLLVILILLFSSIQIKKENNKKSLSLQLNSPREALLFCFLVFLIPLILSAVTLNLPQSRYYIVSAVAFYILLAKGLVEILKNKNIFLILLRPLFLFGLTLVVVLTSLSIARAGTPKGVWEDAATFVKENNPDLVVVSPSGWVVTHYLEESQFPLLVLRPPKNFPQSEDPLQNTLRYTWNWEYKNMDADDERSLREQLQHIPSDTSQIVYIYYVRSKKGKAAQALLEHMGFVCIKRFTQRPFTRDGPHNIILMEREERLDTPPC